MAETLPAPVSQHAPLAQEIAREIKDLEAILANFGLKKDEFDQIAETPEFQAILSAERAKWGDDKNTQARVRIKSAVMFEQLLPVLFARFKNDKESLGNIVKGIELFARTAGLAEPERTVLTQGNGFSITINMGEDAKLTKDVKPIITIDPVSTVQPEPEGTAPPTEVSAIPEGSGSPS